MAPPRPLHCGIGGSLVSRPWRHLAARCTGSVRGPPAQTANDSGVWGVAGGEAEAREKTGPSQRCSGRAGDSGCPPPAGGKQKIPEAQGRGGSWNSARPAHQNLRKGRVANNCFLWKKKKSFILTNHSAGVACPSHKAFIRIS